jgi:hypothetical protein
MQVDRSDAWILSDRQPAWSWGLTFCSRAIERLIEPTRVHA